MVLELAGSLEKRDQARVDLTRRGTQTERNKLLVAEHLSHLSQNTRLAGTDIS